MANSLGEFIAAEVQRAETDFKNFRDRGLSVVGITGTIVGLVSGLLAIAAGSRKDILPGNDLWILVAALLAFVIAAIFALIIVMPEDVTAADAAALGDFVENNWDDAGWDKQVASLQVDYLKTLRTANSKAAGLLTMAISFEISGIFLIASTSIAIIHNLQHVT